MGLPGTARATQIRAAPVEAAVTGVRVAVSEDLEGLMTLESSFPEGQRWSEDSWRGELTGTGRHVLVCDGSPGLAAAATFSLSDDVVDLHRIVTAASARRQGLARRLVDAGIAWAQEMGADRMLLEVEAGNAPALFLYESTGFHRISERLNYYGPGVHASILERGISSAIEGEQP